CSRPAESPRIAPSPRTPDTAGARAGRTTRRRRPNPSPSARGTTAAFSSAVQVVLQNDGGSRRVELLFSLPPVAFVHCQTTFGFSTRQAFVCRDNPQRRPCPQRVDERLHARCR